MAISYSLRPTGKIYARNSNDSVAHRVLKIAAPRPQSDEDHNKYVRKAIRGDNGEHQIAPCRIAECHSRAPTYRSPLIKNYLGHFTSATAGEAPFC